MQDQFVAVKLIHPRVGGALGGGEGGVRSMEHELQIMARLDHPNVVCHLGRGGRRLPGVLGGFGLGYNPWIPCNLNFPNVVCFKNGRKEAVHPAVDSCSATTGLVGGRVVLSMGIPFMLSLLLHTASCKHNAWLYFSRPTSLPPLCALHSCACTAATCTRPVPHLTLSPNPACSCACMAAIWAPPIASW